MNIFNAIVNNNIDAIKKYDGNINILDGNKNNLLVKAIYFDRLKIIKILISKGIDINFNDIYHQNMFVLAVFNKKVDIVRYFIKQSTLFNDEERRKIIQFLFHYGELIKNLNVGKNE